MASAKEELAALNKVVTVLETLDETTRARVLGYVTDRYTAVNKPLES